MKKKRYLYRHNHDHEGCKACVDNALKQGCLRSENAYLRRQFGFLRDRIDRLLAAVIHSGGGKKF